MVDTPDRLTEVLLEEGELFACCSVLVDVISRLDAGRGRAMRLAAISAMVLGWIKMIEFKSF